MESRSASSDGHGDITFHWHEVKAEVFLGFTTEGPRVEIAWTPTPESGVRVFMEMDEVTELAEALRFALSAYDRFIAGDGLDDSGSDWTLSPSPEDLPPTFSASPWPQAGEF
ncbi:hypothetical protein H0264_28895 [Nocardia huaxiensis]|uniref:Uncharacterized protein n=1 Tax=Nocardia huaxiensis TaxID=2755382 RepID=A0A7D6Z811_9NOCA|nr:hypothetical protein [Nocardia huaxiensis]QLY29268.1 hypothetical protein H0264_28895 [Nocardia huaxiensis]